MKTISLKELLTIIPDILQYFVSGFIFITVYKNICSKKIDAIIQFISSCVISFTLVSLIRAINSIWFQQVWLNNLWVIVSLSIVLSLVTSILFSKLFVSKWFHRFTVKYFGISPHSSVWRNIVTGDSASFKVYLKGKNFFWIGSLYSYEEKGDNSWFCLHKPIKCDMNGDPIYSQGDNDDAFLAFNIKDVESIEIFR